MRQIGGDELLKIVETMVNAIEYWMEETPTDEEYDKLFSLLQPPLEEFFGYPEFNNYN